MKNTKAKAPKVNKTALPISKLMPNILTLAGLCAGLTSIRYALDDKWVHSVVFILIASFLDGADGRLARLLKATSNFGAQLDSLSDIVCFGVAPVFVVYLWKLHFITIPKLGWAIVLIYIVCMAVRLARFNSSIGEKKPIWAAQFFVGVPAPAGGMLVLFPLILSFEFEQIEFLQSTLFVGVHTLVVASLLASKIPTFSLKKVKLEKQYISFFMIAVGVLITALIIEPWIAMIFILVCYYISIPISYIYYLRIKDSKELGNE
jgi:CDP-diacylglycerol--serine O-phosphatidyltransferase